MLTGICQVAGKPSWEGSRWERQHKDLFLPHADIVEVQGVFPRENLQEFFNWGNLKRFPLVSFTKHPSSMHANISPPPPLKITHLSKPAAVKGFVCT